LDATKGYEIVCENVESSSEVMNCVAEDHGKFARHTFSSYQGNPVLATVNIELQQHRPRIILKVR
jgi:hypothetical protein